MDDGKRLNGEGVAQLWDAMVDYIDAYIAAHGGGITPSEGTVKSIRAGKGLKGGLITSSGRISLKVATEDTLGGLYVKYDSAHHVCDIDTIR